MLTNILLLLILVALLLLLWTLLQKKAGAGEKPDEEPLPTFPIPRPESDFVEPPRQEVRILFDEREGAVRIEPPRLILAPNKQAAWSSSSGKIEIRFSPIDSPFGGGSFISAKGGVSLSGIPRVEAPHEREINYLVLFTSSDGRLFTNEASVVVSKRGQTEKGY
ncbi:MAG TPA: hypothetical protein VJ810_16605 [Blastocatellia bacterium]|nr:hypothetical protein [Blastocatellia bacterium]